MSSPTRYSYKFIQTGLFYEHILKSISMGISRKRWHNPHGSPFDTQRTSPPFELIHRNRAGDTILKARPMHFYVQTISTTRIRRSLLGQVAQLLCQNTKEFRRCRCNMLKTKCRPSLSLILFEYKFGTCALRSCGTNPI